MSLSPAKQKFVDLAAAKYGEGATLAMSDVTNDDDDDYDDDIDNDDDGDSGWKDSWNKLL